MSQTADELSPSPSSSSKTSRPTKTLQDAILSLSRCGTLDKLDRRVARKLFLDVPVARLKSYLSLYSVKATGGLNAKKAVEMCFSRYYRGSEKNRMKAVKVFQAVRPCVDYMSLPMESVMASFPDSSANGSIVDIDDNDGDLNGSVSEANSSVVHDESAKSCSDGASVQNGLPLPTSSPMVVELESEPVLRIEPTEIVRTDLLKAKLTSEAKARSESLCDRCHQEPTEAGSPVVSMPVQDLIDDLQSGVAPSPLLFSVPVEVPVVLGLAEPAFYDVISCLANFSFDCTASGFLEPNLVEFPVPDLQHHHKVILGFRCIGRLRDNRQLDTPNGFMYALNDEWKSAEFKKVPPTFSSKMWDSKATTFEHPLVLSVESGTTNQFRFKFSEYPKDQKYSCRYQGYMFLSKERTPEDLLSVLPVLPARSSLNILLGQLTESGGTMAADTVTIPITCNITCKSVTAPCRGTGCDHSRFFNGKSYLEMQRACKIPRWKCTVCNQIVHWSSIRRDELMENIVGKFPGCGSLCVRLRNGVLYFRGILEESDTDKDLED